MASWKAHHDGSSRHDTPPARSALAACAAQRPPCASERRPSVTLPSALAAGGEGGGRGWRAGVEGSLQERAMEAGSAHYGWHDSWYRAPPPQRPGAGASAPCAPADAARGARRRRRPRGARTCHVEQDLRGAREPALGHPRQQHSVLNEDQVAAAAGGRRVQNVVQRVVGGAHPHGAARRAGALRRGGRGAAPWAAALRAAGALGAWGAARARAVCARGAHLLWELRDALAAQEDGRRVRRQHARDRGADAAAADDDGRPLHLMGCGVRCATAAGACARAAAGAWRTGGGRSRGACSVVTWACCPGARRAHWVGVIRGRCRSPGVRSRLTNRAGARGWRCGASGCAGDGHGDMLWG